MDAFPGYTYFDKTRKVLCAMQIVKDAEAADVSGFDTVFPHPENETAIGLSTDEAGAPKDDDSVVAGG